MKSEGSLRSSLWLAWLAGLAGWTGGLVWSVQICTGGGTHAHCTTTITIKSDQPSRRPFISSWCSCCCCCIFDSLLERVTVHL